MTVTLNRVFLYQARGSGARVAARYFLSMTKGTRHRRKRPEQGASPTTLPVFRGGRGLHPGIDATSNTSMLDVADEGDRELLDVVRARLHDGTTPIEVDDLDES